MSLAVEVWWTGEIIHEHGFEVCARCVPGACRCVQSVMDAGGDEACVSLRTTRIVSGWRIPRL